MYLILSSLLSTFTVLTNAENILASEVFVIPITAELFGWDARQLGNETSYQPSLLNAPDLPSWIHYTHSRETDRGYLYGAAPREQRDLQLEIVGLNKRTYETRCKKLDINVAEKRNPAKYEVQLLIESFNVEDLLDQNKTEALLDIFRKRLWLQAADLYVTYLASATELGARLPLNPQEKEGLVIRIGSSVAFSQELYELQKQVQPLRKWMPSSCPRRFARTNVEKSFRDPGFIVNWCFFRLSDDNQQSLQRESARHGSHVVRYSSSDISGRSGWRWMRASKADVPRRSYVKDIIAEMIVTTVVFLLLFVQFLGAFCVDYKETETREQRATMMNNQRGSSEIQMVQYATSKKGTLRSLSIQSSSPNEALLQTPRVSAERNNPFIRPNPPPYNGQYNFFVRDRADF